MKKFLIGFLLVSMGCGTDVTYEEFNTSYEDESTKIDSIIIDSVIVNPIVVESSMKDSVDTSNVIIDDTIDYGISDSLDEMMAYIKYIDSAHVVEQVSSNFTKLKEKDARLESELIQTKSELRKTKRELVQTKDSLIKTKEIVRAIYDISNDSSSNFKLLPIEKPEVSETDSI